MLVTSAVIMGHNGLMSIPQTAASTTLNPFQGSAPLSAPAREEYVKTMLARTTRTAVPIRSAFVQRLAKDANASGERGSMLAKIVKTRSAVHLDAFLFIHAIASSRAPYKATYPSQTWVRALGLDQGTGGGTDDGLEAAQSSWSKVVRRLVDQGLIRREREGRQMSYILLDESGHGSEYVRPTSDKVHGTWFSIPHAYWLEEHYMTMTFPAKVMLLIALSMKSTFTLPFERVPKWYGISQSTAKRGFAELTKKGILSHTIQWRIEPTSPVGYAEVRSYELQGVWSTASRKAASTRPSDAVLFTAPATNGGDEKSVGE